MSNDNRVYQEYYQAHQLQDKSPSDISWIGSLQILFVFGGALFGGPLFDRFGSKVCSPSPKSRECLLTRDRFLVGDMASCNSLCLLCNDDRHLYIILSIYTRARYPRRYFSWHDHVPSHGGHRSIFQQEARSSLGHGNRWILSWGGYIPSCPGENALQPPTRIWMDSAHMRLYHAVYSCPRLYLH